MRKRFRKLTAVLLVVVMIALMIPITTISVSAGTVIENAISWALGIANDDSHGYSQLQNRRWGNPDYDCSTFVITAFANAGCDVEGATYTGNMRSVFENAGFTWIPKSQIDLSNSSQLVREDILLNEANHTEIYIGNNQRVGAHTGTYDIYDRNSPGDNNGREISIYNYSNSSNWDGVLRYRDEPDYLDLGTDFYASVLNAPMWKNISINSDNNVVLNSESSPISAEFVWRFEKQGDGSYKIISMANRKCLDVAGGSGNSGTNVQVYEDNGTDSQRWYIYGSTNNYQLRAKNTECFLDVTGNSSENGTNIQMHTKNDSDAQKFAIYKHDFDFNVADIGTDVYAFIINSPMWKTISVAQNQNVELKSERSPACPNQVWKFERQWDGSYKIISVANGYCLDVWGNSTNSEANVVVDKDNSGNNQRWYVFQKDGYYTLRAKNTQCVLDVKGNSNTDGTNIQMFSENGSDAQKFAIYQIESTLPVTFPVENLGDDFYAPLLKASPWKTLWNNGEGNLELQSEKSNSKFLWRFRRNIDGSYTLYSAYDGKCLNLTGGSHDVGTNVQIVNYNGTDSQRWYIYSHEGSYYIQSKESGKYLDVTGNNSENGTNIEVWNWHGLEAQKFAIYMGDECKLKSPELTSVKQESKSTNFIWSSVYGETNNVIKIWKNNIDENESCYLEKAFGSEITSCDIELPEGNYEAVVEVNN